MAIIVEISLYMFVISYLCKIFAFKYEMLFIFKLPMTGTSTLYVVSVRNKVILLRHLLLLWLILKQLLIQSTLTCIIVYKHFLIFNLIVQCADLVVLFTSCAGIILTLKMAYLDIRMIKKTNFFWWDYLLYAVHIIMERAMAPGIQM